MPAVTKHVPNTPGWFDIGTDVEGAKAFYSGLFGWETADAGPAEETGGYGFFQQGGKMLAGLGASVVVSAMDFPGGRFAVVTDPQGAMLGLMHATA